MEIIDKYAKRLNPAQKNIAAGVVSAVILVLTIAAASSVAGNQYHSGNPFKFADTWFPWVVGISLLGYVLTRIYATANKD
jgi:hypothetical protein